MRYMTDLQNNVLKQATMKKYYWESAGIPVAKLGDMVDYIGVPGITISYCPLSYVTTAVVNTDGELLNNEKLQNLMKALYLYYKATK